MAFNLLLASLAVLASLAFSLSNSGSFTYSVTVPTPCSGRASSKCCPDGPCQLAYRLAIDMHDNIDSFPSNKACAAPCAAHLTVCEAGCNRLAGEKDGQKGDSMVCKCTRPASMWWAVYGKCVEACKRGAKRCKDACMDGKCPATADSKVKFNMKMDGICANFCVYRKMGASTVKKICHA